MAKLEDFVSLWLSGYDLISCMTFSTLTSNNQNICIILSDKHCDFYLIRATPPPSSATLSPLLQRSNERNNPSGDWRRFSPPETCRRRRRPSARERRAATEEHGPRRTDGRSCYYLGWPPCCRRRRCRGYAARLPVRKIRNHNARPSVRGSAEGAG